MEEQELNVNNEETFKNIDHLNKTVSKPLPTQITDIDTKGNFYSHLMDAAENGILDISTINSFTQISRSRDEVYNLLDIMAEDPIISSALNIYASDVCEPNDKGQIIWCESDDERIFNCVESLLDSLNIDKNSYDWVHSLIKYGDLYLRLFRESDFKVFDKVVRNFKNDQEKRKLDEDFNNNKIDKNIYDKLLKEINDTKKLNEDVTIKAYSKNDRYADYIEINKNPAQVFDLVKFGKSYGYLKTKFQTQRKKEDILTPRYENQWRYSFDVGDVDVYEATEFVHACLSDNSDRAEEEVSLTTGEDEESTISFSVKRGQSILYDSFKIWRELSLLENAVLLNRITQSSVIRCVNVEVPDEDTSAAKNILRRVKTMFEQKSAVNVGTSMSEYANAGPVQNTIYIPTHEGVGSVSISDAGGNVNIGDLTDLEYWKNKLAGSLGIPKQYLGDTNDNTGFNGGTSLSLISSRYAKTIKAIQNTYLQAITDVINLILLDKGLKEYINKFRLKMQAPTTQEEKDRKDNLNNSVSVIQSVMNLLDPVQTPRSKLVILKALLSEVINNTEVIATLQSEIDAIDSGQSDIKTEEGDEFGGDLGGGFSGGGELPSPEDVLGGAEENAEAAAENELEPLDMGGETGTPTGTEGFRKTKGGEALNERKDLPSFEDIGISYTDVK